MKTIPCFLEQASSSPVTYRVMAYPPNYEQIKTMPEVDRRKPTIHINTSWFFRTDRESPKMYLAPELNKDNNDTDTETTAVLYENHSSIPFWFNNNGRFYGEVKLTGQMIRCTIVRLPDEDNAGGELILDLFDCKFNDGVPPDDDPFWQDAFREKQKLIGRLDLNNNLNLYTVTENKYGHFTIEFKPF